MKEEVSSHIRESVPVRLLVQKHEDQILTLNKAHDRTMEDIQEIKDDMKLLRSDILGIKVWILSAAVAGLLVVAGEALYFGGFLNQINVSAQDIKELKDMHPRK